MILYLPVSFTINFERPAIVDNHIQLVIRSLIGKNLKEMSCVKEEISCGSCLYSSSCVYARLFETVIDKDKSPIIGTNRASHPYALTDGDDVELNDRVSQYRFQITFFGNEYASNLVYIFKALEKAGKDGMFKERVKFSVNMAFENSPIPVDGNVISRSIKPYIFDEKEYFKQSEFRRVKVCIKSPFRFQINGKYEKDFSSLDFFRCLNRRYKIMTALYGASDTIVEGIEKTETSIQKNNLQWSRRNRYSARQNKQMKFDGLIGSFVIEGFFSGYEYMLLKFAEIGNCGKNTNFGCGILRLCENLD